MDWKVTRSFFLLSYPIEATCYKSDSASARTGNPASIPIARVLYLHHQNLLSHQLCVHEASLLHIYSFRKDSAIFSLVADFPLQKFWDMSNINTLFLLCPTAWPFTFMGTLRSCVIYLSPLTVSNTAISTHEMLGLALSRSQKQLHQYHWCKGIAINNFWVSRPSSTPAPLAHFARVANK